MTAWKKLPSGGARPFHCQRVEPSEWRLTEQGELALKDLNEGRSREVFEFVLKRGFFYMRESVWGKGRLVQIQKVKIDDNAPIDVRIVNLDAVAAAIFEVFEKRFAEMQSAAAQAGGTTGSSGKNKEGEQLTASGDGAAAPTPPAPRALVPFGAVRREMVIYDDRITICDATVWTDTHQPDLRKAFLLLRKKDQHGYVKIKGVALNKELRRDADNSISGRIRDFRSRTIAVLKKNGIECGPFDILLTEYEGYHFADNMDIRVVNSNDQSVPAKAQGKATETAAGLPSDPVLRRLNDRQRWVLEQIDQKKKLRHKDIVQKMQVRSTVNRDLKKLRELKLIRLHEDGYYVRVEKAGGTPPASKPPGGVGGRAQDSAPRPGAVSGRFLGP